MTIIQLLELLASIIVAIISLVIPLKLPELKWIRFYCIFNALADIIIDILSLHGKNNTLFIYLFILIEIYILFQFFSTISFKLEITSKLYFYVIIFLLIIGIILSSKHPLDFNPYTLILEGALIFACSIIYFLEELKSPTVPFLYEEPVSWFVTGFLLYYGSTWIILLGIQFVVLKPEYFTYIWDGQNILNILKNIAIAIGLLCSSRN